MITSNKHIGTHIGSYQLVAEISSHSSHHIFLGRRISTTGVEQIAAVKLFQSFPYTKLQQEAFLKEARFLQQLRHQHILPILDVGFEQNTPFIIMEYAVGGSLQSRLQHITPTPMETAEALLILSPCVQAIQYAHAHGILHCNLKPSNILFNAHGDVQISDFSLNSLTLQSLQKTVASSVYMAPEQVVGIVSPESDQYALGSIAYEMLTGHPPFEGQVGPSYKFEQLVPPSQLNLNLPSHIDQAITTAMAKGLTQRHCNLQTFLRTLERSSTTQANLRLLVPATTITTPPQPAIRYIDTFSTLPLLPTTPEPASLQQRRPAPQPAPLSGVFASLKGLSQAHADKKRATRKRMIILLSCSMALLSVLGLMIYLFSLPSSRYATTSRPTTRTHSSPITVPTRATTTPVTTDTPIVISITPIATANTTPTAASTVITITATPTSQPAPSPTPSPLPQPTPTPTPTTVPTNQLSVAPTTFSSLNCHNQGVNYKCNVLLSLSNTTTGDSPWSASANGINATFNAPNGTLGPGQSVSVLVYIFNNCKTHGTLIFTTADSTAVAYYDFVRRGGT